MPVRSSKAVWEGNLAQGQGQMSLGSGAYTGAYSFQSRMENGAGTNPEELIGAALAGCFSMALSASLQKENFSPRRIESEAKVSFDKQDGGWAITHIDLQTEGDVEGIDAATFQAIAENAKATCPVGKALASVPIQLNARLLSKAT